MSTHAHSRFALLATLALAPLTAALADTVDGYFTGSGQKTKLTYAAAIEADTSETSGEPAIAVVLAEKAPADGSVTFESAQDGEVGSFVIATFRRDPLAKRHDSIQHTNMRTSINYGAGGLLTAEDLKLEKGILSGRLTSEGENSSFGEPLDIDATFSVKDSPAN